MIIYPINDVHRSYIMDYAVLAAFILYFAVVLYIGYYFYNRSHSMEDYILGGRSMNPYVTALSAQASDMSSWLLMGLPGSIMLMGLGEVWIGIGLAVGSYMSWLFAAKKIRKHSVVAGNALTLPQFYANRFKDKSGIISLICSVIILFFFIIYVASGFKGCGTILVTIFPGLDLAIAMLVGAIIIIAYTLMGGYKAVCWTDFFQAILMVVAVVVVPLAALGHLGGWNEVSTSLSTVFDGNFLDLFSDGGEKMAPLVIMSLLAWGFGYFGMPHIVVRYMSIRHPEEVKVARRVSLVWIIVALTAVCFIAITGRAYLIEQGYTFVDGGVLDPSGASYNPENIFVTMASNLFIPIVAGFLFAAVMAAIMSTADSQLLVASSSITNDLLGGRFGLTDSKLMWLSRIVVVIVAVLALILALFGGDNIMGLVSYAWAGFGAAFGPLTILALYWKRMNLHGAVATMLVGFVTVIVWKYAFAASTGIYELLPGFFFALFAGIIVSLITPAPSAEILQEFDDAQNYVEE